MREGVGACGPSPLPQSLLFKPADRGSLNFSRAPEAHAYLAALHQDRHLPGPLGELKHLFQGLGIFQHIPINDLQPFLGFGLPGLQRKGSTLFAENGNFFSHGPPL